MSHEWHRVIAHVDAHPTTDMAELARKAIRAVHEPTLRRRDGKPVVLAHWDEILIAVAGSPLTAAELCDLYLSHYYDLGGIRWTAAGAA